jgi:hypothetical protein
MKKSIREKKKGVALTFKVLMRANFVPWRLIVNKIKALRFTLVGFSNLLPLLLPNCLVWNETGRHSRVSPFLFPAKRYVLGLGATVSSELQNRGSQVRALPLLPVKSIT